MTKHILFIAAILGVMTTACQYNYKKDSNSLANAAVCCRNFSEINYRSLPLNKKVSIPVQTFLPAFYFPEGKRFFRAFSLPIAGSPLQITISSPIAHNVIVKPKILLLDENYKITRTFQVDKDYDWEARKYRKVVFIDQRNQRETYIIIYPETSSGKIAGQQEIRNPIQVGHGILVVPITVGHTSKKTDYVFNPTGPMNIEAKEYKLKSANKEIEQQGHK